MEGKERQDREEVYTKVVRAGKRTYFFDVKEMRSGELYITITESKRRFDQENGKFFYEKHKLFLYKEDYDKFTNALSNIIHFVRTGEKLEDEVVQDEVSFSDSFNSDLDSTQDSTEE
ncbi:MAG: DNA-binding protein [Marinilabiliales bacterium]|nr:MAG: DNA-binding protein [Marinilabiliales bacterium]